MDSQSQGLVQSDGVQDRSVVQVSGWGQRGDRGDGGRRPLGVFLIRKQPFCLGVSRPEPGVGAAECYYLRLWVTAGLEDKVWVCSLPCASEVNNWEQKSHHVCKNKWDASQFLKGENKMAAIKRKFYFWAQTATNQGTVGGSGVQK